MNSTLSLPVWLVCPVFVTLPGVSALSNSKPSDRIYDRRRFLIFSLKWNYQTRLSMRETDILSLFILSSPKRGWPNQGKDDMSVSVKRVILVGPLNPH